jgi:hypothetical protein
MATGAIPAVSTPLASDPVAAERHLRHLQDLLEQPKVLTTERLLKELSIVDTLDTVTLEEIAHSMSESSAMVGQTVIHNGLSSTPQSDAGDTNEFHSFLSQKILGPSPDHFVVRPDGRLVPLIPADELPVDIDLIGLERSIKIEQTRGLLSLGLVTGSGNNYRHKNAFRNGVVEIGMETSGALLLAFLN